MDNLPDHVGNITEHTAHHNPMHHGGDFDDSLIPKTVDDRIMQHVNNGLRELTIATRPRMATQLRTTAFVMPAAPVAANNPIPPNIVIQIAQFNANRKRITIGLTAGAALLVGATASAFAGLLLPSTSAPTTPGGFFLYDQYSNYPDIEYVGPLWAVNITAGAILTSVMEESY